MNEFHTPVMLKEIIEFLNIQQEAWYVDCNIGGGGHTQEILKRGGKVLGIDLDKEAISYLTTSMNPYIQTGDLILKQDNFANLKKIIEEFQISKIKGILFDLGLSSHQLDNPDRGFSFQSDAPLDMRMDQSIGATAADLINGLYENELVELFIKYGEENYPKRLAKKIVEIRSSRPITTTKQLADLVSSVIHTRGKINPATKIFQALRIAVNDELGNLEKALPQAVEVLDGGGRLVVLSFHSLEDRIVKDFIKVQVDMGQVQSLTKKPIKPTEEEVRQNPRSRSAKLRAAEKLTS